MVITGQITDSENDPLPGAIVYASDANSKPLIPTFSATADAYGTFKLTLPGNLENGYISASFVGKKHQTVRPAGITNFKMPTLGNLEEIEIIAPNPPAKKQPKGLAPKKSPEKDYTNYYIAFGFLILIAGAILYKTKKTTS